MKKKCNLLFIIVLFCMILLPKNTFALSNNVFLNGTGGNDSNSGDSPTFAVKTFAKAKSLLANGGTIWISGEITVSSDESWDLAGYGAPNGVIKRWDGVSVPFLSVADIVPYTGRFIYVNPGIKLSLTNLVMDGNKDNVTGVTTNSMIIQTTGDLYIDNCIFKDNKSPASGVVINSRANTTYRPVIEIKNSVFSGNEGISSGSANGTIAYDKGNIIVDNTEFKDNFNQSSGVLCSAYKSGITDRTLTITNSSFTGNSGDKGGLAIDAYDTVKVTDTTFDSNTSNTQTIYLNGASTMTIEDSTITNNVAVTGGGIYITNASAVLNLNNVDITGNTATNKGSAIYMNSGTINIKGTNNIYDNVNSDTKGDIYLPSGRKLTIVDDLENSKIGVLTAVKPTATAPVVVAIPEDGYTVDDMYYKQFISNADSYITANKEYNTNNNQVVLVIPYKVTLDYNGGSHNHKSSEILKIYPIRYLLDEDYQNPTRAGYTFDGWIDKNNNIITDLTTELINSDRTYKANWKINNYDVTFTSAVGGTVTGDPQSIKYGSNATSGATATPISTEYDFIGWSYDYIAADGTRKTGTATDYTTVNIYGDVEFTAVYAKKPFVSVISTGNGFVSISKDGTVIPTTTNSKWEVNTTTDPLPVNAIINYTVNTGYELDSITFVDLYNHTHTVDVTKTEEQKFKVGNENPLKEVSITLDTGNKKMDIKGIETTLKYTVSFKKKSYKLNFETNGGSSITSEDVLYDELGTKPTDPTKTYYDFVGWYKDAALTTEFDFLIDKVTEDTTIYAKWKIKEYEVSFDSDGGEDFVNEEVEANNTIILPIPTKEGFTFQGWYTDSSYTTQFTDTTRVTGNTKLYAKWQKNNEESTNPDNNQPDSIENPNTSDKIFKYLITLLVSGLIIIRYKKKEKLCKIGR